MTISTRRRGRSLLGLATSALMVAGGLVLAPVAANAAEETVDGGSLEWGFLESWRSYVTGFMAKGAVSPVAPATKPGDSIVYANASGTIDLDSSTGTLSYEGGMQSRGHADADGGWGLDQTIADPQITVTSDTTATLSFVVTQSAYSGFPDRGGVRETIADLTFESGDLADGSVTATATMTEAGSVVYGPANPSYNPGAGLDELSFSFQVEEKVAVQTTTGLNVSAATVLAGESVDLSATVAPADAAGTVTFKNNGAALNGASNIAVVNGAAQAEGIVLPTGTNSIVAEFAPNDAAAFTASASGAQTVQVNAIPAVDTATAIEATEGPVVVGEEVTIDASVTADNDEVPAGSVEFFSLASAHEPRVSVGTADLDAEGNASLTTSELAAGGYAFVAVFTPEDATAYNASDQTTPTSGRTAYYLNVVDVAAPTPYEPGANAQISEGATASWGWNAYSAGWTKIADGENIALAEDGETFEFSNGEVVADAGGAVISFSGSLRTQAYESFFPTAGQWVELVDPALHLNADGSGVWVAGVNTGDSTYAANADAPRLVVGVVDGYTGGSFGVDGERVATFAYADATAAGTWLADQTSAWPNAFILEVPSAIRSFYYASGAGGDVNKPASDLTVDFDWPAFTSTQLLVAPANAAELGDTVSLHAEITAGAEGTVEFFNTNEATGVEEKLGEAQVADGAADLELTNLAAGGNSLRATFTSSNGYLPSESEAGDYRVVDTAQADLCWTDIDDSEILTGVNATWGWSAYSNGWEKFASGDVSVDGDDFVLSNGVAMVSNDCTSIAFTGTLRVEAYQGFFPEHGQWVELVNPVLVMDQDGNGAWTAGVRTGVAELNTDVSNRMTIVEIAGAEGFDFSENTVDASVEFAYEDTTAVGTWKAGYTSAWSNAFVWEVPAAIQSFYYGSGAGGDVNKPASAMTIDWAFDAEAAANEVLVNGTENPEVEQGKQVTFEGSQFRAGDEVAVVVNSEPIDLGTVVVGATGVASVVWTVPADFELGKHTVTFTSTSTDASVSGDFTVVEPAAASGNGGSGSNTAGGLATTGSDGFVGAGVLALMALLAGAGLMLARRRNAA